MECCFPLCLFWLTLWVMSPAEALCIQFHVLSTGGKRVVRLQVSGVSHTAREWSPREHQGSREQRKKREGWEKPGDKLSSPGEKRKDTVTGAEGKISTHFQVPFYNDFLQFLCISLVLEGSAMYRSEGNLSDSFHLMGSGHWTGLSGWEAGTGPTEPSPALHLDFCSLLPFNLKCPSQAHAFEHLGSVSDTVLGNHRIFGLAGRHNSGLFEDSRVALCFWIVPHNKLLLSRIQPCLCHRTDLSRSTVLPLSASVCHFVIATRKITDSSTCQRTWREISVQVEALAQGSHGIYPDDISCIKRVHSTHACIVYPPSGSKNAAASIPDTHLPPGIADEDRIHIQIWLPDNWVSQTWDT